MSRIPQFSCENYFFEASFNSKLAILQQGHLKHVLEMLAKVVLNSAITMSFFLLQGDEFSILFISHLQPSLLPANDHANPTVGGNCPTSCSEAEGAARGNK